jgi:hypothetical protein
MSKKPAWALGAEEKVNKKINTKTLCLVKIITLFILKSFKTSTF